MSQSGKGRGQARLTASASKREKGDLLTNNSNMLY
jgi:hypothetical protein